MRSCQRGLQNKSTTKLVLKPAKILLDKHGKVKVGEGTNKSSPQQNEIWRRPTRGQVDVWIKEQTQPPPEVDPNPDTWTKQVATIRFWTLCLAARPAGPFTRAEPDCGSASFILKPGTICRKEGNVMGNRGSGPNGRIFSPARNCSLALPYGV